MVMMHIWVIPADRDWKPLTSIHDRKIKVEATMRLLTRISILLLFSSTMIYAERAKHAISGQWIASVAEWADADVLCSMAINHTTQQ